MIAKLNQNLLNAGSFLIGATIFSNFLNFSFNAFLGNKLSFEQYSLVTLINTLSYIGIVVFGAISATVNHRVAYLIARNGKGAGNLFYRRAMKRSLRVVAIMTLIWLISIRALSNFFNLSSILPLVLLLPVLIFSTLGAISGGFMKGRFKFYYIGLFFILEAVTKFLFSLLFVSSGHANFTYIAIPASIVLSSIITVVIALFQSQTTHKDHTVSYRFPKWFFISALLTGLSTNAFLTFDVIITKHYFSETNAGMYAFLALIGKMIFFFGSLFNEFVIPFVSRDQGARRDPNRSFYFIFLLTSLFSFGAYFGLIILGPVILPLIFGDKVTQILPYIGTYGLGITLYTITNSILIYHLARKHYLFSFVTLAMTTVMLFGIVDFHRSIQEVINVLLITSCINLVVIVVLHFLQRNGGFIVANMIDLFGLVFPISQPKLINGKKRILIFNWYDIKHVWAGGAEYYIHNLAKKLVENGHNVTIFCGNDGRNVRYETIDSIRIIRRGGLFTVPIWAFLYFVFRFRNSYDLIIDSAKGVPFFTPLYTKKPIISLVCHLHQEMFRRGLKFPLSRVAMYLEEVAFPVIYKKVHMLTISESTKQAMEEVGFGSIKPITIIEPGVEIKKALIKKTTHPSLIYVGRLRDYKNLDVAIKAVAGLVKSHPNLQFTIAGDGEAKDKLVRLVHKLKLEKWIIFKGKVTEEEKAFLFTQSWVALHPSEVEGWGITNIEANICGTPVIASDVPGLRDSVIQNQTGILVPLRNVAALSQAIDNVISHSRLRMALSRKATKWGLNFSWDRSSHMGMRLVNYFFINSSPLNFSKNMLLKRRGNKKLTITIGIPAFNEEKNILNLLRSCLVQKSKYFTIDKVILSIDGSTDGTNSVANRVHDYRLMVINNPTRQGIARGLNQIIKNANSDILITLDADIEIKDSDFFEQLVQPLVLLDIDLTSSSIKELDSTNYFQNILSTSIKLKDVLYTRFKKGNNIYTCHGLARAYSKRFYKKLHFPVSIGNDMFTYLKCKSLKLKYQYAPKAEAWYKLPSTFADHQKQSIRFLAHNEREQKKYFKSDFVDSEVKIPTSEYLRACIDALPIIVRNPITTMCYLVTHAITRLNMRGKKTNHMWEIAVSSK